MRRQRGAVVIWFAVLIFPLLVIGMFVLLDYLKYHRREMVLYDTSNYVAEYWVAQNSGDLYRDYGIRTLLDNNDEAHISTLLCAEDETITVKAIEFGGPLNNIQRIREVIVRSHSFRFNMTSAESLVSYLGILDGIQDLFGIAESFMETLIAVDDFLVSYNNFKEGIGYDLDEINTTIQVDLESLVRDYQDLSSPDDGSSGSETKERLISCLSELEKSTERILISLEGAKELVGLSGAIRQMIEALSEISLLEDLTVFSDNLGHLEAQLESFIEVAYEEVNTLKTITSDLLRAIRSSAILDDTQIDGILTTISTAHSFLTHPSWEEKAKVIAGAVDFYAIEAWLKDQVSEDFEMLSQIYGGDIPKEAFERLPSRTYLLCEDEKESLHWPVKGGYISRLRKSFEQIKTTLAYFDELGRNLYEKAILCDYVLTYMNYNVPSEFETREGYLGQVEYILGGNRYGSINASYVDGQIGLLRLGSNAIALLIRKQAEIQMISGELAAITGGVTYPVAYGLVVLGWSISESVADLTQLHAGESVPLIKLFGDFTVELDFSIFLEEGGSEIVIDDIFKTLGVAWTYKDYLRWLLLLMPEEKMLARVADQWALSSDTGLDYHFTTFAMDLTSEFEGSIYKGVIVKCPILLSLYPTGPE